MLTSAQANAKTEALNKAFAGIGVEGDTKMPRAKLNTEPVAWEVYISQHLVRLADARKAAAVKAAVALGVMFDPAKSPRAVCTNELIYAGDVVEIALSVTTPAARVDVVALGVALVKAGVKLAVFERLLKQATSDNRAPHKFVSTLITEPT